MICDVCKKKEAIIHITKIDYGHRTELHLCADCAREQGPLSPYVDWGNIINNDFFRKMAYPDYKGQEENEPHCGSCGMTYSEFNRSGTFGCPDCYEAFGDEMEPLVRRIHGHIKHIGKVPNRGTGVFRTARQIKRLRQQLQKLVQEEKYEDAAKLRDEIKALERQLPSNDAGKEAR